MVGVVGEDLLQAVVGDVGDADAERPLPQHLGGLGQRGTFGFEERLPGLDRLGFGARRFRRQCGEGGLHRFGLRRIEALDELDDAGEGLVLTRHTGVGGLLRHLVRHRGGLLGALDAIGGGALVHAVATAAVGGARLEPFLVRRRRTFVHGLRRGHDRPRDE